MSTKHSVKASQQEGSPSWPDRISRIQDRLAEAETALGNLRRERDQLSLLAVEGNGKAREALAGVLTRLRDAEDNREVLTAAVEQAMTAHAEEQRLAEEQLQAEERKKRDANLLLALQRVLHFDSEIDKALMDLSAALIQRGSAVMAADFLCGGAAGTVSRFLGSSDIQQHRLTSLFKSYNIHRFISANAMNTAASASGSLSELEAPLITRIMENEGLLPEAAVTA